ncbi:MAG: hemerythrin family protein [Sulfurovum sp.]|nr:hemerythrin family protein [Sulfurovum sp.]
MALLYAEQVEYLDVEQMQETHEEEIKILNDVDKLAIAYSMDKAKLPELEAKLGEYLEHVKEHFASEERLMNKYDFPNYEMHKMAHDMFLLDIGITIKQWGKFGNIDKVVNFIRKSPEWIVLHINTVDAPTSAYIAQKMKAEEA